MQIVCFKIVQQLNGLSCNAMIKMAHFLVIGSTVEPREAVPSIDGTVKSVLEEAIDVEKPSPPSCTPLRVHSNGTVIYSIFSFNAI